MKNLILCWDAVAPDIQLRKEFNFPYHGKLRCPATCGQNWSCTLTSMISLYIGRIWDEYCYWETADPLLNGFEKTLFNKGTWGLLGLPWLYPLPDDLKGWGIVGFPNPDMPKCSPHYEKHGRMFTEGLEEDFKILNDSWNKGIYDPAVEYKIKTDILKKTPEVDTVFMEYDSVNRGYHKLGNADDGVMWEQCLWFTNKLLDEFKPDNYIIFSDHGKPKKPKAYDHDGVWASNQDLKLETFEDLIGVLHK